MVSPQALGLREAPGEVILSTLNPDSSPHAATVGVRLKGEEVEMLLFHPSTSLSNLKREGEGVLNVTDDVNLLVRLALRELLSPPKLEFLPSPPGKVPRLKGMRGYANLRVKRIEEEEVEDELGPSRTSRVTCLVERVEVLSQYVKPFLRSEFLLLEAAVIASRILVAKERGLKVRRMMEELRRMVEECLRLSPSSQEAKTAEELLGAVEKRMIG
ncbi:MAG: DUF447 family protein [Candidatus Hadarchaeales archaeon]